MKIYFSTAALVFLVNLCTAQSKFFIGAGIGSYGMGDMRDLQNNFASQFPVTPKIVSSFPWYYTFEIGGVTRIANGPWVGINLGHSSTGGRVSYEDYSGTVHVDQIASNYAIAIPIQFPLDHNEKNNFLLELLPVILLGTLDIKTFSQIGATTSDQVQSFKENDFGFQPSMIFERKVSKTLSLYLKTGYYLQLISSKLVLDSNHSYYLLNSQNKDAHLDWSGVRISGGLAFRVF